MNITKPMIITAPITPKRTFIFLSQLGLGKVTLLPEIFQSTSKEEADKLWSAWYKLASESNVEEITKFAKTQNENYRDGITNAGIYHIGTSVLEGINNKINNNNAT